MVSTETIAALHAVLFACGAPVEAERLRELLGVNTEELTEAVTKLKDLCETPESGVQLIAVESAYQLCTKPFVAETVKKALELRKTPPLSKASLEVLAIVAYNQPVTRAYVEQVRGVDCSAVMQGLVAKSLIEEKGRLELPGRPLLYGTTKDFLRCFGVSCLEELPPLPQMEVAENGEETPMEATLEDIVELAEQAKKLSAAAEQSAEEFAEE